MTDNRTTELLPCPICGGQPDFQHFNITPNVRGCIICACGLSLVQGKDDTDDDMRIIWNTRSDYAVQAANERKSEQAIAATLGRPTFNANLEQALSFMRIWISEDAHLGESAISREFEKAEGLRKLDAIESAIAATLGGVGSEIGSKVGFEVCGGKLTAEQVQAVIFAHSSCAGRVDDKYFAEDIRMQAIADELNATLGSGYCELVYGENDHGDDGWWCQSCGGWFAASFRHTGRNNIIEPSYCQHCGKAVKR